MRIIGGLGAAVVATAVLVNGLLIAPESAAIRGCPDYVFHEGRVVEIGDTTIKIHEWAGVYTYRLGSTERWRLEASQIRQGDKVQFLACSAGEIAKDFKKM
ncbi:MAG: hypothetical protein HY574_08860 [candidate division NC10 bacterium]|nr:hypothetical protein [candidate division NC10 bacterium]